MTPLWQWARARATRDGDDRGAALIYALLFITVVAVVIAAVMSFADTSVRTTVASRDQAAQTAAADGAAQAAINQLRKSTYAGFGPTPCLGSGLELKDFYQPATGAPDSALVTCDPDPDSSIGAMTVSRPSAALVTLGTAANEGIDIQLNGKNETKIAGKISSATGINFDQNNSVLYTTEDLVAPNDCKGKGTYVYAPGKSCSKTATPIGDPGYAPPAAPTKAGVAPTPCAARMEFLPGLYTDRDALNTAMNCAGAIFDFRPGNYFFSFADDSAAWNIKQGYLVAGSPVPVTSAPTTFPSGRCASPLTNPTPNSGVTFFFGRGARMNITQSAKVEICGRNSLTTPPIAIYGLNQDVNDPDPSGLDYSVPKLSGCVLGNSCGVVESDNQSSSVTLYVNGMVYAPSAKINLDMRKDGLQYYYGGIIARTFMLGSPGSAVVSNPMIDLPMPAGGYVSRLVTTLSVYVCPGQGTCSQASGALRLKVKVGFTDLTGNPVAGARQVTVYSWSVQR